MDKIEVPAPFEALLSGWSLIVIVISVAGYSFRWNYYYNFGLQSLVLSAPLESLPVYAIEIVRIPPNPKSSKLYLQAEVAGQALAPKAVE